MCVSEQSSVMILELEWKCNRAVRCDHMAVQCFIDGCMKEMKTKVGNRGARMKLNGCDREVAASIFADDIMLLQDSKKELQRMVDEFYRMHARRNLKVDAGKSKIVVFFWILAHFIG